MNVENCIRAEVMKEHQDTSFDVALIRCYEATKDQELLENLVQRADSWCASSKPFEVSDLNVGKMLYVCYSETKKERYLDGVERVHREWKSFLEKDECRGICLTERLYMAEPFCMAYETAFLNKEHYNEIVTAFEDADMGGEVSLPLATAYAMAIIDTMDVMSKEIFEHYKTLESLFKTTIRGILKTINNENNSCQAIDKSDIERFALSDLAKLSYVILKACRMKVLLQEKYQATGMDLLGYILGVVYDIEDGKFKLAAEDEAMAVTMMAYAEKLMLESAI